MKKALAVNPATTLNIYTCDLSNGLLGYSYLPYSYMKIALCRAWSYYTLPCREARPTPTMKEIPLPMKRVIILDYIHTFENGCTPPGDEVDDTPYEDSPTSGCPIGAR